MAVKMDIRFGWHDRLDDNLATSMWGIP